ncbi:hypothetical protein QBC34DRAFT_478432 [Podospora aff. communis PSN243]|uniref:Fungal N-terminal domain-containing protein n=1 Tax=Podospora aff. communis PSN243 TaxID=3040156 RepID=A0AAV9G3M9_9PEZI|nr:hypothetical protein QBC34DRAFT_478432 [Podospora aff. communis PSN243]
MQVDCGLGDLVTVGGLIMAIISALDDVRGASRDYQNLQESLRVLNTTLNLITGILQDPRRARIAREHEICRTGLQSIQQIKNALATFHDETLKKHLRHLGSNDGSGNRLKAAMRKIQFRIIEDQDILRCKADVAGYTGTLNTIVGTITLCVASQEDEKIRSLVRVLGRRMWRNLTGDSKRARPGKNVGWRVLHVVVVPESRHEARVHSSNAKQAETLSATELHALTNLDDRIGIPLDKQKLPAMITV